MLDTGNIYIDPSMQHPSKELGDNKNHMDRRKALEYAEGTATETVTLPRTLLLLGGGK